MTDKKPWVAVDAQNGCFRFWSIDQSGRISNEASYNAPQSDIASDLNAVLADVMPTLLADDLGHVDVICCGDLGLSPDTFSPVPCAVNTAPIQTGSPNPTLRIHTIAGVKQTAPYDFMQGDETRIAGFLGRSPEYDGIICLPGKYTRWVHISAQEIVSFRSFMTGDLLGHLSSQQMPPLIQTETLDKDVFLKAVTHTMSRPAALASDVFSIRAEQFISDRPSTSAYAHLLGVLIGAELAAAKPYWLGQHVTIIGNEKTSSPYEAALQAQGVAVDLESADAATLAGLAAAYKRVRPE